MGGIREIFFWGAIAVIIILRVLFYFNRDQLFKEGDKVRLSATVLSEPLRFSGSQLIVLNGLKIYLDEFPRVNYGDRLEIIGVVAGDRLKIIEIVKHETQTAFLFTLRKRIIGFYKKWLPTPDSALVAGMAIGSKEGIDREFWKVLTKSGTAHVVVASGMNVSLVAGTILALSSSYISRKKAVWVALSAIISYAVLSGLAGPIIRASIMGTLALVATAMGKISQAKRALFLSAGLMILLNPSWIVDLGFLLSFAATTSLVFFGSKVNRLLYFVPSIFRVNLSTSLTAQIGVAPIILIAFGQMNFISPLVNTLVLPAVAPITIIGIVSALLGLVFEPLGALLILITYPLTRWFIFIINLVP